MEIKLGKNVQTIIFEIGDILRYQCLRYKSYSTAINQFMTSRSFQSGYQRKMVSCQDCLQDCASCRESWQEEQSCRLTQQEAINHA